MESRRLSKQELEELYIRQKISIHKLAKITGFDRRTIARWLRNEGVKTRSHEEIVEMSRRITPPDVGTLRSLYWDEGLSSERIATRWGVSSIWVRDWMRRLGVPVRTLSEAGTRFPKTPFNGTDSNRAYLQGFRAGDLNCQLYGRLVRVATSSTHPAMWALIRSCFGPYGRVNRIASRRKGSFEWMMYAYLDRSFDFLLPKTSMLPESYMKDELLFLSFLAGYTDAEGSFRIYNQDGHSAVMLG